MKCPDLRLFYFSMFIIFFGSYVHGQPLYEPVFRELRDQQLFDSLVSKYKTYSLLSYAACRDTLFSKIDAVNDSLECIYTGMKRYIPPGADPTEAVLLNGQPNGINTEHAYPQSKGAGDYGRSDMHILYPSRVRTNSNRSNNPFADIEDQQTAIWYYLTNELTFPPVNNRDAYSESTSSFFEPRESVKGNIARSVFYFYTMYRTDADNADPNFFDLQVNDLCRWHFSDPVDNTEWTRNQKIQYYQGNVNPFVLDCSLAARLYCPEISDACENLVSVKENNIENITLFPNPGKGHVTITPVRINSLCTLSVYTVHGTKIFSASESSQGLSAVFSIEKLPAGFYLFHLAGESGQFSKIFKYIIIP